MYEILQKKPTVGAQRYIIIARPSYKIEKHFFVLETQDDLILGSFRTNTIYRFTYHTVIHVCA